MRTYLTHCKDKCGGSVYVDISKILKLVAPSFRVGTRGLGNFTVDTKTLPGKLIPEFECDKCGERITNLGDEMTALCHICGTCHPVRDIFVHDLISGICVGCCKGLREHIKDPASGSKAVKSYASMFNLSKELEVRPLIEVLTSEVSLD